MDTVECMRTFAAVAACSSFTGGAKQLGISTKLASKYVRQLEERLGAQLFNRTTRSVTLTDIGRAYCQRCMPLLDQFDELEGLVQERQGELAGSIRLTAPTGLGSRELVEAIRPFQCAHPNVHINMHLSDQHVSVIEEGFDLAIRFGALKDSTLIARKLTTMPLLVIASPQYLAQHGNPSHPSALTTHNCLIQTSASDPHTWTFLVDGQPQSFRVDGSFHANSPRAVTHMAVGGLGIALCPSYVARPFIDTGALEVLFSSYCASQLGLYAVYPPGRHLTARVRALIDHLTDQFK